MLARHSRSMILGTQQDEVQRKAESGLEGLLHLAPSPARENPWLRSEHINQVDIERGRTGRERCRRRGHQIGLGASHNSVAFLTCPRDTQGVHLESVSAVVANIAGTTA